MSNIEERGYTFDRPLGRNRPLTDKEQALLEEKRRSFIQNGQQFVKENDQRYADALVGKLTRSKITIGFTSDEDYVHFINWVYEDERRLEDINFTNVPIHTSCTVTGKLLREALNHTQSIKPITLEDFSFAAQAIVSPYGFDRANIEGLHVPFVLSEE